MEDPTNNAIVKNDFMSNLSGIFDQLNTNDLMYYDTTLKKQEFIQHIGQQQKAVAQLASLKMKIGADMGKKMQSPFNMEQSYSNEPSTADTKGTNGSILNMTMDSGDQQTSVSFGKADLQNEKNLQTLTKMIDTVLFFCNDIELMNKLYSESKDKQAQTTDENLYQSFTTPNMSDKQDMSSSILSRKMSL